MQLSAARKHILLAVSAGRILKAHRDLEGRKIFRLHPLQGEPEIIEGADVQALGVAGLLDSNKKFPAATFWLTEKGRQLVAELA